MNTLITLAICSIVIQFVTEQIKKVVAAANNPEVTPLIALVLGIAISLATQAGIFSAFGIMIKPIWFDYIITGVAYSGGAVAFNELLKLISELRPSNKVSG